MRHVADPRCSDVKRWQKEVNHYAHTPLLNIDEIKTLPGQHARFTAS